VNLKKLEEKRDAAWERYKETNKPVGQAKFYYKDNLEYWKFGWNECTAELLPIIEELKKALEYYAAPDTWSTNSGKIGITPINEDWENVPGSVDYRMAGGKKARDALKKLGER